MLGHTRLYNEQKHFGTSASQVKDSIITLFCNPLNLKWIKAGFRIFRQGRIFFKWAHFQGMESLDKVFQYDGPSGVEAAYLSRERRGKQKPNCKANRFRTLPLFIKK